PTERLWKNIILEKTTKIEANKLIRILALLLLYTVTPPSACHSAQTFKIAKLYHSTFVVLMKSS
ncbi:MAG TPA: hypothetical protein PLO77_07635, partial [Thermoclostridium caenicola]|nr:hypothetical protein [Thermoclostridium caenicola]